MATVLNTYRVAYHFEQLSKNAGPAYVSYLQATAGDYASLKTVMTNNGLIRPGTLVIDLAQEVGHGDVANA